MNLNNIKNIYIIGIEGAGTSALALILQAQGKNVVGSDEGDHFYYEALQRAGIKVFHKFDMENLKTPKNFRSSNFDPLYTGGEGDSQNFRSSDFKSQHSSRVAFGEVQSLKNLRDEKSKNKLIYNKIDLVIYSTSVQSESNEELKEAMEASKARPSEGSKRLKGLAFSEQFDSSKILSYPQALAMVFNQSDFGIAVCGTHGKTTTTAMLGTVLKNTKQKVTALVGSKVLGWGGQGFLVTDSNIDVCKNPKLKRSRENYFVIEADEYQNKLQHYLPQAVILTSVDYDHPDFFKTPEDYKQVFKDFVAKIPKDGFLVAYGGDEDVVEVSKSAQCEVIFYDLLGAKDILLGNNFCADTSCRGNTFGCCPIAKEGKKVRLFGEHNLLNAMAVFKLCQKLGLDEEMIKKSLREFQGTARRFEEKGKYHGAIIIDDYAHHPVEVEATLKMAREKYPDKNIKIIFHPHTFTRTEALLNDFAKSFKLADEVYLLDIFGSAREKQGGVSSDDLVNKIKEVSKFFEAVPLPERSEGEVRPLKNLRNKKVVKKQKIIKNLHTIPEAIKYFKNNLTKDDLLITMGAGDVYLVGEELIKSN